MREPSRILTDWIDKLPLGPVLDIGCGNGRNALYLARRGFEVTALEPNTRLDRELPVTIEEEGLPIKIIEKGIGEYKPSANFDTVLCLMVLHFLPAEGIMPSLDKIKSWTNAGGFNIISAFTDENPKGTRNYLFARDELRSHYADWDVVHYDEELTLPFVPSGATKPQQYWAVRIAARKTQD